MIIRKKEKKPDQKYVCQRFYADLCHESLTFGNLLWPAQVIFLLFIQESKKKFWFQLGQRIYLFFKLELRMTYYDPLQSKLKKKLTCVLT